MKFREYTMVLPKVIKATSANALEQEIEKLDIEYDIIDLQYSTTGDLKNGIEYSALLLIKDKELK